MKIACFREFSDPESTLFKNIINFSVDLFSFLNPPTVVPPTFSHFSPTHPFFLSFHRASLASLFSLLFSPFSGKDTRLRRVSFFPSRGSAGIGEQVIPDTVTYVYIVSLPLRFILCVTGQALVLLLRSHFLYLFVRMCPLNHTACCVPCFLDIWPLRKPSLLLFWMLIAV